MSRDTNICIYSGRLTRDPEMKYTPAGKAVCSFSLACNESDDKVNFFDCQAWEKTAEIMTEYCKKGNKILVVGRTNRQRWDDSDGKKHVKNILNIQSFEFMGGKKSESEGGNFEHAKKDYKEDNPFADDDIPF